MSQEAPKSIGEAIEEFSEEDVKDEDGPGTDVSGPDDDTDVSESEDEEEDDGEVPDLEDDDAWGSSPDDDEEGGEEDDEDDEESDESDDEDDEDESDDEEEVDLFETLTPEQLKEVRANPALDTLRKALMRGYNKKMQGRSQLIQLGQAYEADPVGVAKAIAQANGLTIVEGQAIGKAAQAAKTNAEDSTQQKIDKITAAREEVAGLFGDKVGPEVAQKLENFFSALTESVVAPLSNQVGTITQRSEQARMMNEEAAWRSRHKGVITPEIETKVVQLGNSGKFNPGDNMPPGEYLDTLLKIVLADEAPGKIRKAKTASSKRLARRIERNRRSREPGGVSAKAGVKKVSRLKTNPEEFSIESAFDQAARELKESAGL